MIYEERPAPPGFEPFVSRMWYLETPPLRRYEKILPMPYLHLIVNLSDPYHLIGADGRRRSVAPAFISGLQREYLISENPRLLRHVGVEFRASGLRSITDISPREFAGRVQDAEGLLPGIGVLQRHRKPDGSADLTPGAALDALAQHLADARSSAGLDPLVERVLEAIHAEPAIRIGDLAVAAGVTHKTLITRFAAACGVPPKSYAEVWRFHRFVTDLPMGVEVPSWAELAASSPYYDQPHVIRAFRRFGGFTPSEYLERVREFGPEAASFVPLEEIPLHDPRELTR